MSQNLIVKYTAVIIRNKKYLIVRQRDQDIWKNVGGKIEGEETPEECLEREIFEEINTTLVGKPIYYFSLPRTKAVSDPNTELDMHLYTCELANEPTPATEIEEIRWLSKQEYESKKLNLTYQINEYIIPRLIEDKLM